MQARRASRELALILFSQLDKKIISYSDKDFEDIILKSIRVLVNNSTDELRTAVGSLIDIKDYVDTYESNHPDNLERPIGVKDMPVNLPTTKDLSDKISTLLDVVEKSVFALEVVELVALETQEDVKDYAIKIAKSFKKNYKEIDENIQNHSKGWDISRLVKIDKDILRIAIVELMYIKEVPMKVVVDESLELAKKYSTDESSTFINGVLANIILENGLG